MARQSSNPVFARSPQLQESLRGTGFRVPTAGQLHGMYSTPGRLTADDVVVKTAMLLGIVAVTGAVAWVVNLGPGLTGLAGIVGFGLAMVNIFKRQVVPALVLAYAAFEGLFLGSLSHAYESISHGIAAQAILGTAAVFGAVLLGYKTGRLRATPRFTRIVTSAFLGLFGLALLDVVISLFTHSDALGIRGGNVGTSVLFSVAFIAVGAFTFVLDFDQADRMVAAGVDERESWRIAFGLVVGLVWLYLEVLRLLSYLQGRD